MASSAWKQRQRDELRKRLEAAMNAHPAEAEFWISWNLKMKQRDEERKTKGRKK